MVQFRKNIVQFSSIYVQKATVSFNAYPDQTVETMTTQGTAALLMHLAASKIC
jgi:hypothetical protein